MFATIIDGHTVTADTAAEMTELLTRIEERKQKGLRALADALVDDCTAMDKLTKKVPDEPTEALPLPELHKRMNAQMRDSGLSQKPIVGGIKTHDHDSEPCSGKDNIIADVKAAGRRIVCDACKQEVVIHGTLIVCGCNAPRSKEELDSMLPPYSKITGAQTGRTPPTVRNNVRYEATGPGTFTRVPDEPQISNVKLPDVKVDAPGEIESTTAHIVRNTTSAEWLRRQDPRVVSWCLERYAHEARSRVAQRLCAGPQTDIWALRFHDASPDIRKGAELLWPSEAQALDLLSGRLMLRPRAPVDTPMKLYHSRAVFWKVTPVRLKYRDACIDASLIATNADPSSVRFGAPITDEDRQRIEDGYGVFVPLFGYAAEQIVIDMP